MSMTVLQLGGLRFTQFPVGGLELVALIYCNWGRVKMYIFTTLKLLQWLLSCISGYLTLAAKELQ